MMDWLEIESAWTEYGSVAGDRWRRLTPSDLKSIAGRRMRLIGRIQRRYRRSFGAARNQVERWTKALAPSVTAPASSDLRSGGSREASADAETDGDPTLVE
jgi:hypothetical protein